MPRCASNSKITGWKRKAAPPVPAMREMQLQVNLIAHLIIEKSINEHQIDVEWI